MPIDKVRALVAERQRYDEWLAALEARRGDTPPRVFARVHGDYVGRRTDVVTRLQEHVGALAAVGDDLGERLAELDARLVLHEEELAEHMLRNLVGEFDDAHWSALRDEVEAKVAALSAERETLRAEVAEVEALLADARGETQAELRADAPGASPDESPDASRSVMPPETGGRTGLTAAPATPRSPLAEALATGMMVESVNLVPPTMYDVAPPAPVAPEGDEADGHPAAPAEESGVDDVPASPLSSGEERELFGESGGPADPQFVASLEGIQPEHDAGPERVRSRVEFPDPDAPTPRSVTPTGNSAGTPVSGGFSDLAFLRATAHANEAAGSSSTAASASSGAAAPGDAAALQKTLRCTECGTLNLPAEWYCERCGGELATF